MDRAIRTHIRLLASEHVEVREFEALVLANIGAPAVRPLIRKLNDSNALLRRQAAAVLANIGDASMLPGKVLMDTRLTPRERARTLEALRQVDYQDGVTTLRYPLPEIPRYCEQMLQSEEAAVCAEAQAVLNALQRETLLRASERHLPEESHELLRGAHGSASKEPPETLLRSAPLSQPSDNSRKAGLFKRLFRRAQR